MTGQTRHEEIRDLLERGRNLRGCGYPSAALPFFVRAARLEPENDEICAEVQATRRTIHELLLVVEACDRDPFRTSRDVPALLKLADALTRLDRKDEALVAARQAAAVAPDDWETLFTLGNKLNNSDRYEEALAVFDRLIALDPEYAGGWTFKGMALCNLRRYSEALGALHRALTLDPLDVGGWRLTVVALSALGRTNDAKAARKRERAARLASDVPAWRPRDSDEDEDISGDAD
jgi:tetratricopeptide (TPR) repeat protein